MLFSNFLNMVICVFSNYFDNEPQVFNYQKYKNLKEGWSISDSGVPILNETEIIIPKKLIGTNAYDFIKNYQAILRVGVFYPSSRVEIKNSTVIKIKVEDSQSIKITFPLNYFNGYNYLRIDFDHVLGNDIKETQGYLLKKDYVFVECE